MNTHMNKTYITPCSEFLGMDLEGITCASPGGHGGYNEGELSIPIPGDLTDEPILIEDLLQ